MKTTAPRILVPLDGSDLATTAIPVAAKFAGPLGAEVILMRVIVPERSIVADAAPDLPPLADIEERRADQELQRHGAAFGDLHVTRLVLFGLHPSVEIIAWLRDHPVDFVVMATHGRGGLHHLVAGSVTEAVLRSGLAPVIAIRPAAVAAVAGV